MGGAGGSAIADNEAMRMHMSSLIFVAPVLLLVVVAMLIVVRSAKSRFPVVPKQILTAHERVMHMKLNTVVSRMGNRMLFSQVAMAAVMDASRGVTGGERTSIRNRFDRKIIDFVITDLDTNPLLIVELDDRTHDAGRDAARDAMTRAAGIPTLRMRRAKSLTLKDIETALAQHLPPTR